MEKPTNRSGAVTGGGNKMTVDYEKVVATLTGSKSQQLAANIMGYDDVLDIPIYKRVEWNELSKQL